MNNVAAQSLMLWIDENRTNLMTHKTL